MEDIPFSLVVDGRNINGFLSAAMGAGTSGDLPHIFHVMELRNGGMWYCGQLMLNSFKGWWLPDSKYERYAEELGDRVQSWYQ